MLLGDRRLELIPILSAVERSSSVSVPMELLQLHRPRGFRSRHFHPGGIEGVLPIGEQLVSAEVASSLLADAPLVIMEHGLLICVGLREGLGEVDQATFVDR